MASLLGPPGITALRPVAPGVLQPEKPLQAGLSMLGWGGGGRAGWPGQHWDRFILMRTLRLLVFGGWHCESRLLSTMVCEPGTMQLLLGLTYFYTGAIAALWPGCVQAAVLVLVSRPPCVSTRTAIPGSGISAILVPLRRGPHGGEGLAGAWEDCSSPGSGSIGPQMWTSILWP